MLELLSKVNCDVKEKFFSKIEYALENKEKMFVVTANPETFMVAKDNEEYYELLIDKNSIILPDGIGIVKALKKYRFKTRGRITGIDLSLQLLEVGNKKGYTLFLFGAHPNVLKKLVDYIKYKYPNLILKGYYDGYNYNFDKIMKKAVEVQPDILLLALGIPKQEKLIYKYYHDFKKGILMGVGGSFDVISGEKKRAPDVFINLNLEWLYRIIKEPYRIKRFINYNLKFFLELKKEIKQKNET